MRPLVDAVAFWSRLPHGCARRCADGGRVVARPREMAARLLVKRDDEWADELAVELDRLLIDLAIDRLNGHRRGLRDRLSTVWLTVG